MYKSSLSVFGYQFNKIKILSYYENALIVALKLTEILVFFNIFLKNNK